MLWKRLIKIGLLIVVGLVALRLAVYVEPLDKHREALLLKAYSPEQLVTYHWEHDLAATLDKALPIEGIASLTAEEGTVTDIGGKVHYVVKGSSKVAAMTDQSLLVELPENRQGRLPLKHLFGNTAVASTGWFQANDFANTMDYNAASACLNKRLLDTVVKPLMNSLQVGDQLDWVGAIAMAPDQPVPAILDIAPFRLAKKAGNNTLH